MRNGFLRVAAAVPAVNVADVDANVKSIISLAKELDAQGVEIAVFPELCITGYTCGDLFHNFTLLDAALDGLRRVMEGTKELNMHLIVGLPVRAGNAVYNCAAFLGNGRCALIAKSYIPNYNEFYERRWWQPAKDVAPLETPIPWEGEAPLRITAGGIIRSHGVEVGVELCEDLWVPIPPSCRMAMSGAKVIFNLSASDDLIGKYSYLRSLVAQQSARCIAGYVYASAGYGESSTDLVFDGKGLIAENGRILAEKPRWAPSEQYIISDIDISAIERDRMHLGTFEECARDYVCSPGIIFDDNAQTSNEFPDDLRRDIDPRPFVPADDDAIDARATEIINIQAAGLCRRLDFIRCRSLAVGISGGLDSTLALLVAVKAFDRLGFDRKGIVGVTMPGFGTTGRTRENAVKLMTELGITQRQIPIAPAVNQHFADIGHDPANHDVTYENSQARERTQLLMDIANQINGIVLGTGDLSELALGWATYNGDHMSMYGVNAGVPKTLVKYLVRWFARRAESNVCRDVLLDIIDTPISPELTPADDKGNIQQKTEDLVGPYELHDFFLYYMLRYGFEPQRVYGMACHAFRDSEYSPETIKKWLRVFYRRFFAQQFKRSCLPDGPKVGSVCLSPRGDWRMPSDASAALWLKF